MAAATTLSATVIRMTNIHGCARCGLRYDWRRSPSALKMTYCGSLCERGDLGFTIEGLIASIPTPLRTGTADLSGPAREALAGAA